MNLILLFVNNISQKLRDRSVVFSRYSGFLNQ